MREFGELPHFVEQRLNSAAAAAARYCAQFPAPVASAVAGFVAYVAAAAAALVIVVAVTHDWLMERQAWGHTLVWWLAASGMVLAVARSMMEDEAPAYDPVRFCTSANRIFGNRASALKVVAASAGLSKRLVLLAGGGHVCAQSCVVDDG